MVNTAKIDKPDSKPMFFYKTINTKKHNKTSIRRVTIAGFVVGKSLQLGIAQCNAEDQFTKKLGRKIAVGRALKRPKSISSLNENTEKGIGKFFVQCSEEVIKTL